MSIIVSSASALGTPIPRHIDVTGPDVCAALPGGVGVNNVVFRILPKCACDDGALRPLSKIAKQLNSASGLNVTVESGSGFPWGFRRASLADAHRDRRRSNSR